MGAPCCDDHVAAISGIEHGLIILWTVGIAGADHLLRVGRAKSKDVGHQKPVESLSLGKTADAGERWVEHLLIGRAWVEPDPHDQPITEQRIDLMEQRVTVAPVG